jgi:hypothetical protein
MHVFQILLTILCSLIDEKILILFVDIFLDDDSDVGSPQTVIPQSTPHLPAAPAFIPHPMQI